MTLIFPLIFANPREYKQRIPGLACLIGVPSIDDYKPSWLRLIIKSR